jgi:hypothetical protein
MRKMIAVAAVSLTLGVVIGTYGFQGHADAAAPLRCPASVQTKFLNMLGQRGMVRVPPGCTDRCC